MAAFFSFFQKKAPVDEATKAAIKKAVLKLSGMHCVACSLTIDVTLEELPGVIESNTNYAQSKTTVTYNENVISLPQLKEAIESLGYHIV